MPRRITTPWLREIYQSATVPTVTPSDGARPLTGNHAAGTVATISRSPAAMAEPSGDAIPDRHPGVAASNRPARPSAPIPEGGVSPFARMVLSISQRTGCSVEEARDHARLQLDRLNSPARPVAAERLGNTHYLNPVPFRIGAAALPQRAAPSRDRRVRVHAPFSHGAKS